MVTTPKEKTLKVRREREECKLEGDRWATHQDGQHDVLEVIPQVGGVGAEENKVALHQLEEGERSNVHTLVDRCVLSSQRCRSELSEPSDGSASVCLSVCVCVCEWCRKTLLCSHCFH